MTTMLHDVHCCCCDWDGYTDDLNGECPGCHTRASLEPNFDESDPEWDEEDEWDEWDVMDEDPGM